jgi:hypothetical protein
LKRRWANYYFFVKKALKAVSKCTLFSKPRTEKDLYLANATKFVIAKLFKYLKDLAMLPFSALKVQLKLRRRLSEEEKRDLLEVLEASRKILETQLT